MPPDRSSSRDEPDVDAILDLQTRTAFPMIQPMNAALYFDDIEGFGEWSILLSTRAQKALREVKRADGAMFEIAFEKIR